MRIDPHACRETVTQWHVVAFALGVGALGCASIANDPPAPASERTTSTLTVPISAGDISVDGRSGAAYFSSMRRGTCTLVKDGPCEWIACDDVVEGRADSAGTVVIESEKRRVTLVPDQNGNYAADPKQDGNFEPGEAIKVTAMGAAVPAFEAKLEMPRAITLTSLVVSGSQSSEATFSRHKPLQLSWTGGGTGELHVSLSGRGGEGTAIGDGAGKLPSFECYFRADAGSGTIPASVVADLGPGGHMFIGPQVRHDIEVGGYAISLMTEGSYVPVVFTTTN